MATSETRDGEGAGDHDFKYAFGGDTLAGMTLWERMHLMLMRGDIKDFRAGKKGGAADGDVNAPE